MPEVTTTTTTTTTTAPAAGATPALEPGFPCSRWYRVEYQLTSPRYNEEGEFIGETPMTNPDGSPLTRKVVVFGLHKVARIANRISVNRMIRKLEEVPVEAIAAAAQAHEEEVRQRELERLEARAAELRATAEQAQTAEAEGDQAADAAAERE